jgi:hypothetical protein
MTGGLFLGMGRGEERAKLQSAQSRCSVVHDGWMECRVHGYVGLSGAWGNSRGRAVGGH